MKTKTLGWLVGLGAIASSFLSCSQAPVECQVALAGSTLPYIVVYTPKGTPPACAMSSGILQDGDFLGMEFYHPATADGTTYDSTKATVAIQPSHINDVRGAYDSVGLGDPCNSIQSCLTDTDCANVMGNKCNTGYCVPSSCDKPHHTYAYGSFASEAPDTKNFCPVMTIDPADQKLAGGNDTSGNGLAGGDCTKDEDCQDAMADDPTQAGVICDATTSKCVVGCRGTAGTPNSCIAPFGCTSTDDTKGDCTLPADEIQYSWSNLNVFVTAAAPGTQFSADMTYTENGCAIDYTVTGMWPAVACEGLTCMDESDPSTCAPSGMPDPDFCSPCADPLNPKASKNRVTGSGINPNFPTKCAPLMGTFYCVLDTSKGPVPQINETGIQCP